MFPRIFSRVITEVTRFINRVVRMFSSMKFQDINYVSHCLSVYEMSLDFARFHPLLEGFMKKQDMKTRYFFDSGPSQIYLLDEMNL